MSWFLENLGPLLRLTMMHAYQALVPLAVGFVIALLLGRLAAGSPRLRPFILGLGSVLFTIPSLALFVVLPLILGTKILDVANVLVALTIYAVALLVQTSTSAFMSLERAPLEAADAMGYTPLRRFLGVELPLAVPVLIAGARVVSVSSIAGVSVGALIGVPNLGYLFKDGLSKDFPAEIVVGLVLTVALALVVDLLLLGLERALTPWKAAKR
ncbi:ABC transporter permease [Falsarthrobacter nasiphocae]|uniref:Osmoprotectant transport system permease protein n=1 Tax=Falsarthrobacter nasiphocae TaxID=189863 RepID=A0AAE3YGV7_9MICC|nr:ABC transporter permease subunit [Falsarthrobacter nasiphocae]MDR6891571.1 osmoprotectant transport system permease protein [Falsarthrobacter nasiphocae]